MYRQQALSPHNQQTRSSRSNRASPVLSSSPHQVPVTPRTTTTTRSKAANTVQLHYLQQFAQQPQQPLQHSSLNNHRQQAPQQSHQIIKAPLKIPVINNTSNKVNNNGYQAIHELRLKENESKMRESRLDNYNHNHDAYDLNSETILILPNKEKTQIEAVMLSATPNGRIQMKKVSSTMVKCSKVSPEIKHLFKGCFNARFLAVKRTCKVLKRV